VSFKIGYNHYSKPVNLGPQINTSKAEFAPFLSKDNKTLYFSTEGHGGFGMSDIYVANRLDNSWGNWSKPRNIGPNINTSSWEGYFSITDEGDYAYFVSSEGNRRDAENIYRIPLLKDVEQPDNHLQVAVKGRVFNVRNNKPLLAEVNLLSGEGENILALSDAIEGHYELPVSHDGTYTLQVKARGFISYEEEIDIKVFEQQDVYLDVFLTPIEVGQVFALNKLYFHQGKPELLNASFPELQKLVQVLQENPGMVIELAGHTDRLGNKDLNKELSFDRVENIKGHLVEAGIDRARIETIGYGSAHPVAPSDTEENRRKNRRVEIKILQVAESF
jgi:outer membrane protein OmpA-like peptidoglycan-associated protein